jgi:hypothetical protein
MRIAKFLAAAAFVSAPLSVLSAQSVIQPDSGSSHHPSGKWVAGAGAAAGAALFLSFTGHSADSHNAFTQVGTGTPPSDPGSPTAGATPPPVTTPPADSTVGDQAPPQDTSSVTPPDSAATTPPDTSTVTGPTSQNNPPSVDPGKPDGPTNGDVPHEDAPPGLDQGTSTVPEPGSLALTATGIIGLLPLIRRRRK